MKPDEFAKAKKFGRIIVDLGVAASLQGGMYAAYAKHMLGREIVHNSSLYVFLAEATDELITYYLLMMYHGNHDYRVIFLVFSDDACYAIKRPEGQLLGNLDISSCDASHTPTMLNFCLEALRFPVDVANAMRKQMMTPMKINNRSPKGQKPESAMITPTCMHLPSGITITTVVNCVAILCIWWRTIHSDIDSEQDVIDAAAAVGYKVTLGAVHIPEDYQFLKRSLARTTNGEYFVTLNLGVILRASGVCRGDLPGRGCIYTRAMKFQRALMKGLLHGIECPDLNRLIPEADDIIISEKHFSFNHTFSRPTCDRSYSLYDLTRRYALTDHEVEELRYGVLSSSFGDITHSLAVEKILRIDYGLELPV